MKNISSKIKLITKFNTKFFKQKTNLFKNSTNYLLFRSHKTRYIFNKRYFSTNINNFENIKSEHTENIKPDNTENIKSDNSENVIDPSSKNVTKLTLLDKLNAQLVGTQDLKDLFVEMEKRKYSIRKIAAVVGTITIIVLIGCYEFIIDFFSTQATTVTTRSLDNESFQQEIIEVGTKVGKEIVKNLSCDPEIKDMLAELFKNIFKTEIINLAGSDLANEVVTRILLDDRYEPLRETAYDFVRKKMIEITCDKILHKKTGYMAWESFKYALLPTFIVGCPKNSD